MLGNEEIGEQLPSNQGKPVEVTGDRIGMEYENVGATFPLSNIFGEDAQHLGGDKFTAVYFTTVSGNTYLIRENQMDLSGEIVNAKESSKQGRPFVRQVERDALAKLKLSIGNPFYFPAEGGKIANTTRVNKITAVNSQRIYMAGYLKSLGLEKSTVIEDFKKASQPQTTQA